MVICLARGHWSFGATFKPSVSRRSINIGPAIALSQRHDQWESELMRDWHVYYVFVVGGAVFNAHCTTAMPSVSQLSHMRPSVSVCARRACLSVCLFVCLLSGIHTPRVWKRYAGADTKRIRDVSEQHCVGLSAAYSPRTRGRYAGLSTDTGCPQSAQLGGSARIESSSIWADSVRVYRAHYTLLDGYVRTPRAARSVNAALYSLRLYQNGAS